MPDTTNTQTALTRPRITILYCTQCNWLLRAGWMAQELLQTFGQDIGEVALIPGTGGNFEIRCNDELIWERKRDGGFPGPKELKQRLRDRIWPDRDLGHTDRAANGENPEPKEPSQNPG
ncbi:SelT/SelW/SelH family protein [Neorhizobium sp. JUb45]|uniref:SelT/SelW/SelH family protein n=1 Tax=unclassified Neorhizobium TaxID=2629175 RepID=UPI00104A59E3|nr:SelT/SelW/SelH family protein [Neorhizobium sp. JUb45]TCR01903.1 selenoprotein W-related protein [Neorhizobium sp. JUb45]